MTRSADTSWRQNSCTASGVVGGVLVVVGERDRGINLIRPGLNLHLDAELVERTIISA